MSLTDALLLDPPKVNLAAPSEVWIALRVNGQKGSGTQEDPFNGATIKTAPLSITSLTRPDPSGKPLEALAVTNANHGLNVDDVIEISTGTANGDWWDGTFQVTATPASNSFKYLMQREPVAAASANRTVQMPLSYLFDERMKEMPASTTIHIGPGVFETRGFNPFLNPPGWEARSGQRIL